MFKKTLSFENSALAELLVNQLNRTHSKSCVTQLIGAQELQFSCEPSPDILSAVEEFQRSVGRFAKRASQKTIASFKGTGGPSRHRSIDEYATRHSDGILSYHGILLELTDLVDRTVTESWKYLNPIPISLPEILEKLELEKLGYLPRDRSQIADLQVSPEKGRPCCLTPAICLPFYRDLPRWCRGQDLMQHFTLRGRAFRNEGGDIDRIHPMMRLKQYQVRELISVYRGASAVTEMRSLFLDLAEKISRELGLAIEVATASDLFFEASDAQLAVQQLLNQSKWEMRVKIQSADGDQSLSIASLNLHEDHFSKLYLGPQTSHKTYCIGVGLERAAYAVFCQTQGAHV